MKPKPFFFYPCTFLFYLLILVLVCNCTKNTIHLQYKIISEFSINAPWVDFGTFFLKKNSISVLNDSTDYINEKKKFLKQIKENSSYEYVLFRLCYNLPSPEKKERELNTEHNREKNIETENISKNNYEKNQKQQGEEESCVQTFAYKKQIDGLEDFLIHMVLDSNNLPLGISLKTYNHNINNIMNTNTSTSSIRNNAFLERFPNRSLNLFLLKNATVSESIQWNNLLVPNKTPTPATPKEMDNTGNEKGKGREEPQSFIRKFWYAIIIFFISFSISKHFAEILQQTINEHNSQPTQ